MPVSTPVSSTGSTPGSIPGTVPGTTPVKRSAVSLPVVSGYPRLLFTIAAAVVIVIAVMVVAPIIDGSALKSARFLSVHIPPVHQTESLPGGSATVTYTPIASFMLPTPELTPQLKTDFYAGKALANQPWVKAPSSTNARDGLGPLYNARSCIACHRNGGRGTLPDTSGPLLSSAVLRLSTPGITHDKGVVPEPVYGEQLQHQSIALSHQLRHLKPQISVQETAPEGRIVVNWHYSEFTYPDHSRTQLRKPDVTIADLAYGPMTDNTRHSLRNTPTLIGLGLLELIRDEDLEKLTDPDDSNGDGISGRINRVWNPQTQQVENGRFGWKASRPTLMTTIAAAFQADIGISNSIFPAQPCTVNQTLCNRAPQGNDHPLQVELPDHLLQLTQDFITNIGVPKQRSDNRTAQQRGRTLFYKANCNACHIPGYTTGVSTAYPHLSSQQIWPYTDLLLHDMGAGLADNRTDFQADGQEWRTPPLWGIGLSKKVNGSTSLLHDGRARNIEEAILWHGGEGADSRAYFTGMPVNDRRELLRFVESL